MLEKALNNAQDRLMAKERAAKDAAALVDKCTHQQKLLQESLEEKQKLQEKHNKHVAQLEMELAQAKVQAPKEGGGVPRKAPRSSDGDEPCKLQQQLVQKDKRIAQLEVSLAALQQRTGGEQQHDDTGKAQHL